MAVAALLTFTGALALASSASAATTTFTVNDTSDAPLAASPGTPCESTDGANECTLRAAVEAADDAGGESTIVLPEGKYIREGNGALQVGSSEHFVGIAIEGSGQSSTVIDANKEGRVFSISSSGASLKLEDVTLTGGSEPIGPGGAIANEAGTVTITNCALTANAASRGGAIFDVDGAVTTIAYSSLSGNEAKEEGGAIFNLFGGTAAITDSVLRDNEAAGGGAIFNVVEGSAVISGSTLEGNDAGAGGAIFDAERGVAVIDSSTLSGNRAPYGGAILNVEGSRATVTASSFEGNEAKEEGGAILNAEGGTATVSGSTFEGNESKVGGAILDAEAGRTSIERSTFTDNEAESIGGAILDVEQGVTKVTESAFSGNRAGNAGGAITTVAEGSVAVSNSTFTGNGSEFGGAIAEGPEGTLTATNSTFLHNSAERVGGAFATEEGSAKLVNDTIAENNAALGGGILWHPAAGAPTAIANTIVADNTPEGCGEGPVGAADAGGNIDSDSSCFATGGAGTAPEANGDQPGVAPLLGPLAENGGPTETMALLEGSPALGHGVAGYCPSADQRGIARPSGACDVGAFQSVPADLAVTLSAPAAAAEGGVIPYTITLTNNGPHATSAITLNDALPAGVSLYSAVASSGSCSGATTVSCSLPALEPGQSGEVIVAVVANAAGTVVNTATATAGAGDPNTSNNTAKATTEVSAPSSGSQTQSKAQPTLAPRASTGKASERTQKTVLLSGKVNPEGSATTWRFVYGTSKKQLKRMTAKRSAGSGDTAVGILAVIKGLKPGHRYYVELVAQNANGTVHGKLITFKTKGHKRNKKHRHKTRSAHKHHSSRGAQRAAWRHDIRRHAWK